MMSVLKVLEYKDGYKYQGPRFISLGPDSGEEFREEYLLKWLDDNKNESELIVDFDGTIVYTPSFLEESFGGAIRKGYEQVRRIKFINMPDYALNQVNSYIKAAKVQK